MGIFNLFKKQFIDVIEWLEDGDGVLSWRYPMIDQEIQNGAQLIVREGQQVVLIDNGKLADGFGPGRYRLSTANLPVLTSLRNWDKLFKSPFKTDVYYFSTREQVDRRWGTAQAITLKDQTLGLIRLRAHGSYSFKVADSALFHRKISGSRESYSSLELEGQLKTIILTRLATFFGQGEMNFLNVAGDQSRFSHLLKDGIAPEFKNFGLQLESFWVQSLTLPTEVQNRIDKVTSMNMVGDLRRYTEFQVADSISSAAENPSGIGAMGAQFAIANSMSQTLMQGAKTQGQDAPTENPLETIEKLHALAKKGVISEDEFQAKKTELLKKIG